MAKVMIIDDNPFICQLIEGRLKANGYDVVTVSDPREALDMARSEKPDLILLDISMPHLDGFQVGALLRDCLDTRYIPIIMVTARGEHRDTVKAISELDVVGYIVKPFRPENLLDQIKTVLSKEEEQKKDSDQAKDKGPARS